MCVVACLFGFFCFVLFCFVRVDVFVGNETAIFQHEKLPSLFAWERKIEYNNFHLLKLINRESQHCSVTIDQNII